MNSNIKKILTALLAVALVVTTVFPGSRSVYAEEKPTAEMLTTEEEKQASALKETLNDEGQLDKQGQTNPEETGLQNIVDQNALSETASPQEKQEESVKTTETETLVAPQTQPAFPVKAPENSTGKVELEIARLVGNKLEKMPTDWYTQQVVDSVVDLDISGNNYSIEKPYLLLRLPKTDKIMDVKFVDSAAGKTERYEDENYQYIKYTYTRLIGGTHYTYQYYFTFDGHHAKNGDSIEAQAQLFDGNGKLVKEVKQTYTAKTVGFELWSAHGNSGMWNIHKTVNNDGHDYDVWGFINKKGDTKTIARAGNRTNVFAAVYPKKIQGINASVGIEYPKNLKIVYTYQQNEPGFREFSPKGEGYHDVGGLKNIRNYTWTQNDNVYTFLIKDPTFDSNARGVEIATNGRYATYANSVMKDNGVTVNKKLPIRIDYYKNANDDGTGGELLGTRYENFTFIPHVYQGGYGFSYQKFSFGNYNIADEFVYIYHPDYYHLNSKFYKGNFNMADKGGIPLTTFVSNWNAGSSYSNPYEGGKTDKVTEIYTKLLTSATYFKSVQLRAIISNGQNTNNDKHKAAIEDAINSGNTKLYGIDKDGRETMLRDRIKYNEIVSIEDSSRKYVELVVRFENPVELDNMTLQLRERQWFVSSELDALQKLGDGMHTYESKCAVTRLDDSNNPVTGKYVGYRGKPTYFTVTPLHPTVDSYISKPQVVEYKEDATFDYLVGPKLPRIAHDENVPYGDLEELKNVKTITLLPSGYEYAGEYEKEMYDSDWVRNKIADPTITTVENYQGSGKTAVIVDYGTIKKSTYYPIKLKLRATKYAARGASDFVNYMTYDDNDFIRPLQATGNANDYVDALDLDQDGDTTEIFMQKHTTVTFVPPLELVIQNAVKHDQEFQQEITGDLGYGVTQKINIFNNSIREISKLSIIDVLPYKGDHSISPNGKGEYPNRQSTFAMPLTKSLEEMNDQTVNDKVSFFYQLTDQGCDLASVRDGQWFTANQVTDFSKVRSVKIVLKDGQALKSKEELNILLPSKIPGDTKLDEKNDVAVNSSAFSTDGTSYTEGNITKVRFTTYKVTGIAFLDRDKDKDGRYNSNDDRLQKNVTVKVLNKDGSQAVDFNNKPIIGKTDENGAYSLPVYKRGNYVVAFVKSAGQKFNAATSGEETVANSIDPATIKDNTAQTMAFALNPAHRSQVKNVALLAQYGQIKIIKTSENEKDANGQPMKLAGVEFALTTQDGQPVQDDQDKTIANVTTDEKGEAIFKGIPYGDYVVKEVKAADRYAMPTSGTNVTVSDKTAPDSDKPIVVNITNVLIRGTITIHKTDASSRKKPLAGVEFTLYDDQGKEIAKKTTDKNGDITFADLVYGAYTVKETKGLRGYCAFKQDIIVEIKENGKTYHYDVENKAFHYPPTSNPSTPTLPVKPQPKTGDSNRLLFWSALLGMSTLSLTFLYAAREKTRSRKKR
ncbi:MSCRAMM family protein [Levyella massiliensis]|uniref:MSCRAMM family protein n=1 Tax=Levyella massiliensis TaxID=938289 RepID=UPI0024ACAD66|nr:SpaA isopeptide-forming pilin-related protein [Levyella massiliensis]